MKYYKNTQTNEVFAFDETDATQLPYMQEKIDAGYQDVSDSWPPVQTHIEPEPIQVTKEELLAQIQILTDKINALSS
jgi:hypothetical protein